MVAARSPASTKKTKAASRRSVVGDALSATTERCPTGQRLVKGRCEDRDPEPLAVLAPEDRGYRDTQGGAGWGNRCFVHVRARRLENARAACQQGLAVNPSPAIEGAILYSLAVAEELAGDPRRACRLLGQSLDVRPGNGPTRAKHDALRCDRPGTGG